MLPAESLHHRSKNIQGFGVFENIGGDISLIKPGLELSEAN